MLVRVGPAFLTLVIICAAIGSVPVWAQKITGDIAAEVTGSTGAVVAGVAITLENLGTKLTRTATTNEAGNFRINDLPIGTYRVAVSAPGFKTTERKAEVVAAGLTNANFSLQIGQRSETIEVEGTTPLLETSPYNNNYLDNAKIEAVPLNGPPLHSSLRN